VTPIVLEHDHVRLESLRPEHFDGLAKVCADPALFRFMSFGSLSAPHQLHAWMEAVLREPEQGTGLAFAIVDRATGNVAGSTSYLDVRPGDRGLEIGRTWLGKNYQRSALNSECKLLLLGHAFDTLGALRVQIKTDLRNVQSQEAIARLGATREGVLRSHMVMADGYVRDTVMFSIVAAEWPHVRQGVIDRLARYNVADSP
jgi:RimJ/RimL family protein N-acetyltransferase